MKAIFAKLGVTSRPELTALLHWSVSPSFVQPASCPWCRSFHVGQT